MKEEDLIAEYLKTNEVKKCPDSYSGIDLLGNDIGGEIVLKESKNRHGLKSWKKNDKTCKLCDNVIEYDFKTALRKYCTSCSSYTTEERSIIRKYSFDKLRIYKEAKDKIIPLKYIAFNIPRLLREQIKFREIVNEIDGKESITEHIERIRNWLKHANKRSGFLGGSGLIDNKLKEITITNLETNETEIILLLPWSIGDLTKCLDIPIGDSYIIYSRVRSNNGTTYKWECIKSYSNDYLKYRIEMRTLIHGNICIQEGNLKS